MFAMLNQVRTQFQVDGFLQSFKKSPFVIISFILLNTLVLTLSAKISIPWYPVPVTLQSLVVVLTGYVLGSRLGTLVMLTYLVEGALGLPVFQGTPERGIGLPYMLGPTGGYLIGFVGAAFLVGYLSEKGLFTKGFVAVLAGLLMGHLVIYTGGIAWLSTFMPMVDALVAGFVVFIPSTIATLFLQTSIVYALERHKKH